MPTSPLGEALRLLPGETVHTQANAGADVPKVIQNMHLKQYFSGKEMICKHCIELQITLGACKEMLFQCSFMFQVALVLFLGGYTLAEVAAFRYCAACQFESIATLHSVSQVASDSDWLSVCGGRHQQL